MPDPDRFSTLMLEHVFGLLEPDEINVLETHLATPEGAELKARAARWKDQLAGAAKAEFPGVHFTAPSAAAPAVPSRRTTVSDPTPPRQPMRAAWTKWAIVAGLLLVVAGLGGPAARQFAGWYTQSAETKRLLAASIEKRATSPEVEFWCTTANGKMVLLE